MTLAACGGGGRAQTDRSRLAVFDDCISHTDFLVLIHHAAKRSIIETIKDRARKDVVGEVATAASERILGQGADAGTRRYLMSTARPLGRDAMTIENCWDRFSPITR